MDNENIEERLYSMVFHDPKEDNSGQVEPYYPPNPPNVTTPNYDFNNRDVNRQSGKRYWLNEKPTNPRAPKFNQISQNPLTEKTSSPSSSPAPVKFVPYNSVLSNLNLQSTSAKQQPNKKQQQNQKKSPNLNKSKKNQKIKNPKTKLLNPMCKSAMEKLQNAQKMKQKRQQQQNNQETQKNVGQQTETVVIVSSSENEEDDEVVAVEQPSPEVFDIESSDESIACKKEFTEPRCVKSIKSSGNLNSPRPVSPSSNSMMSDDFIVTPDKARLNESFGNDNEVQNTQIQNSPKSTGSGNKTLEEIQNQMTLTESSSAQNTDRSSCEKEKELEKERIQSENRMETNSNEDSIYGTKAKKRIELSARKRSLSNRPSDDKSSSNEEDNIIVPKKAKMKRRKSAGGKSSGKNTGDSESEEVETDPRHKLFASTPREVRRKSNRATFDSVSYADDDFSAMLSTVVQDDDRDESDSDEIDVEKPEEQTVVNLILEPTSIANRDENHGENSEMEPMVNPVVSVIEIEDSTIAPVHTTIIHSFEDDLEMVEEENDCTIIEKPIETIEVEDDTVMQTPTKVKPSRSKQNLTKSPRVIEIADDSPEKRNTALKVITARPWVQQIPDDCDLMLNIRQSNFEQHEYIRDYDPDKPKTQQNIASDISRSDAGWNEEMKFFYNHSWGGEKFSLKEMMDKMPRDRALWKINRSDYLVRPTDTRFKCHNCNEFGHMKAKCRKPKKRIVCAMCGEEGHRLTRCARTICLRCGKPNDIYSPGCSGCAKFENKFCPLCRVKGHDISLCPDKWRRYHSTTTETINLNSEVKYNTENVWCCVCAKKGHWAEECASADRVVSGIRMPGTYEIKSHKPIYPVKTNLNEEEDSDNQQVFNLISYFENFQLDNSNIMNPGGFYSRIEAIRQKEEEAAKAAEKVARKASKKRRRKSKRSFDKNFQMQQDFTFEGSSLNGNQNPEPSTSSTQDLQNLRFSEEYKKIDGNSDEVMKITLNTRNNGRLVNFEGREAVSPYNFEEYFNDPHSPGKFVRHPKTPIKLSELRHRHENATQVNESSLGQHENFKKSSPSTGSLNYENLAVVLNSSGGSCRLVKPQENQEPGKFVKKLSLSPEKPDDEAPRNSPVIPTTEFFTTPGVTPGQSRPNSDDESSGVLASKRDLFSQSVMPDYIALGGDDDDEKMEDSSSKTVKEYENEQPTESKILLSKSHMNILLNSTGRNFLAAMENSYSINLSVENDELGHTMVVTGLLSDQQLFQQELKDFLYKIESEEFEKHQIMSSQVPKDRSKLILVIQQNIKSLSKRYDSPEKIYDEMMEAEKNFDFKKVMKTRKLLNLVLLGQKGLGDGKKHLGALKVLLGGLLQDNSSTDKAVDKETRNTISQHMLYIFSSEKQDYTQLLEEYLSKRPKMINPLFMMQSKSQIAGTSNKIEELPEVPPPPKWNYPNSNVRNNYNQSQSQPPKWNPSISPKPQNTGHANQLVQKSKQFLMHIHHSSEKDSVLSVLDDYQQKIKVGQLSQNNFKKLKNIYKVLQDKVRGNRN